jgi:drug/metabolite transporter (DMT)-like permease
LAGAIAMAGYLLLSRASPAALSSRVYLGIAYGTAALLLWLAVLVTQTPAAGFDARTWWALAGMALLSQLIGHSGYNWSLRHLSPQFVAVVLVGEPVLASCLGWWLLGEELDWRTGTGGALILAGIALCAMAAREPRRA